MTIASLLKLAKNNEVLAGSAAGRKMSDTLWKLAKASAPGLFVIDCGGIVVMTSSFMREGIVTFRKRIREEMPGLYPVLTNLGPDVEEELVNLLNQMGEAFWVFDIGTKGAVRNRLLIGRLDPKLKETLDLINAGLGHDAATLWKGTNSTESIGVTAWNNRLASLSKQGLVFESRVGKQKYFHPLNECRG